MILAHTLVSVTIFLSLLAVGFIVVSSGVKWSSKVLIVSLLTTSGIFSYRAMNDVYGYPIVMQRSFEDVVVVAHKIQDDGKFIHIWIQEGENSPRSYTIPYSKKMGDFLNGMRTKHRGEPYRAKFKVNYNPLSPLNESVEQVEAGELTVFPPK